MEAKSKIENGMDLLDGFKERDEIMVARKQMVAKRPVILIQCLGGQKENWIEALL